MSSIKFVVLIVIGGIIIALSAQNNAPHKSWQSATHESTLVDFGEVMDISAFRFYTNGGGSFMLVASVDGRSWRTLYYSQGEHSASRRHRIIFEDYTDARFVEIISFEASSKSETK